MTQKEIDQKLVDLIDEPFLNKLAEVAKLYGWSGDYTEIGGFVACLFELKKLQPPDLEPYESDDD